MLINRALRLLKGSFGENSLLKTFSHSFFFILPTPCKHCVLSPWYQSSETNCCLRPNSTIDVFHSASFPLHTSSRLLLSLCPLVHFFCPLLTFTLFSALKLLHYSITLLPSLTVPFTCFFSPKCFHNFLCFVCIF